MMIILIITFMHQFCLLAFFVVVVDVVIVAIGLLNCSWLNICCWPSANAIVLWFDVTPVCMFVHELTNLSLLHFDRPRSTKKSYHHYYHIFVLDCVCTWRASDRCRLRRPLLQNIIFTCAVLIDRKFYIWMNIIYFPFSDGFCGAQFVSRAFA